MAVELDYMEYADDAAAQAAYVSSDFNPGSWDLLDEDCVAIDDWNDEDTGDAVSSVSPAGQFKFDSGPNSAANDYLARRTRDIGSYPNVFTLEVKLYHDAIGNRVTDADHLELRLDLDDERLQIYFGLDGLWVYDSDTGYAEIGTNLVKCNGSAEWQTWRFLCDFTGAAAVGVMDVYLKDSTHNWEKVGSAIQCSVTGTGGNGKTWMSQLGYATNNRITHVDHIKVYAGSKIPSLQCYSESTIKQQGSYSLKTIARATDSLNDTLTRAVAPTIDLSNQTKIIFDVRASRTGSQFKISIHDSGGTTTNHTVNISVANTWQEENWDISGVVNANKDAIDEIKVTVLNADAENVFYLDEAYAASIKLLAGISTIESTVTGELSRIRALAGTAAITCTVTCELTAVKELAGVVEISSVVTGTLTAIKELAGTAAIACTVTAELTKVGVKELVGVVAIGSIVTGILTATKKLAGVVTISSTTAGELTRIGIQLLAGVVNISCTVTGELITRYILIPPFMHKDLIDPYGDMGAWLWLAEIVVPTQATQRIASNTEAVVYGITSFVASNFDVGRIPLAGDGSVPRIQLRVAQDETGALEDIVNATKGGENGTIKLIRTCEKYFDSPIKALERTYDILTAGSDSQWVTFVLGIPNPLTQRIPLWSYSSKVCPLATPSLFKGPRCQYAGEDAVCTGLLEDCYTKGNAAHWGAEAGLDPAAVRI